MVLDNALRHTTTHNHKNKKSHIISPKVKNSFRKIKI